MENLWKWLADIMTLFALLWSVDFFGWFGFNFVSEQFYAFSLDSALAVVFLSVRIDRPGG